MALNVASLLDGASLGQGTLDKALAGMNKVLTIKNVSLESSEKGSVMVTIGTRSYLFATQANGILQVSAVQGADALKALAKCSARLVLDPVAFNNEVGNLGEAWEEALRERRKMYVEGDEMLYVLLHNALVPHVSSLQAATPAVAGAKQDDAVALDMWKGLEPPALQVANLTADTDGPPLGGQMRGWLMFSAVSTMFGNMGQSNYAASNQFMDALTFSARQVRSCCFEAHTIMWGTVGHMGMRWKAFGSADMIYADMGGEDIVMMPFEAAICLKTVFEGVCPEWFVANKFDTATTAAFRGGGWPANPDPWGMKKGKGGGSDLHGDLPEPLQTNSKSAPASSATSSRAKGAYEGRRVRLHRLEKATDMNGKKGTLVEAMEDGNWIVRLDGGLGDKILKVSNLMTLSGTQLETGERHCSAAVLPPADAYVKMA